MPCKDCNHQVTVATFDAAAAMRTNNPELVTPEILRHAGYCSIRKVLLRIPPLQVVTGPGTDYLSDHGEED